MEIIAIEFIGTISTIISVITEFGQTDACAGGHTTELIIRVTILCWSRESAILERNIVNSNVTLETV